MSKATVITSGGAVPGELNKDLGGATVPVTASVLKWAVEESGFSKEALAENLNLSAEVLGEWENGAAQPTRKQFEALAETLKRPSGVFFLPEPPIEKGMPSELRNSPGLAGHHLTPDEVNAIRRALRLQDIVSWVIEDSSRNKVAFPKHRMSTDPVKEANSERQQSGVSSDRQLRWSNTSTAFAAWRDYLQKRGVLVVKLSMGENSIRGFSVWDDYAPLVAVNAEHNSETQTFTLFHEVAHLLTRSDAACHGFVAPDSTLSAERWCERFAAAFLLPEEALRGEAARYGIHSDLPTSDLGKIFLIANRFKVSIRAADNRLGEIGLINPGVNTSTVSKFVAKDCAGSLSRESDSQSVLEQRVDELGTLIPVTLLSAAERGRLTTRDLTDYLEITTGQVEGMKGLAIYERVKKLIVDDLG